MKELPTTDDLFSQNSNLPTTDELFTPPQPSTMGLAKSALSSIVTADNPIDNPAIDSFMKNTAPGRIMSAFGHAFAEGGEGGQLGIQPGSETEQALKKAGIFNDYMNGENNFSKAVGEAFIRPAAVALDTEFRGLQAGLGAVGAGIQQTSEELFGKAPGVLGEIPAITEYMLTTPAGMEVHAIPPEITRARSLAVIGEDEGAYFGLKEPTPEQAIARQKATEAIPEATSDVTSETEVPKDIHTTAREIAPEAFNKYDGLEAQKEDLRGQLAEAEQQRTAEISSKYDGEISELQAKVQEAKERGNKSVYEDILNRRIAERDSALESAEDTQAMQDIRAKIQQTDYAMRDVAPDVSAAYREAQNRMPPEPPEVQESASEELSPQPEQSIPEPRVEIAQQLDNISKDVSDKLTSAGRSLEEAQAASQLVAQHYKAVADQGWAKGTPEEIYKRDSANIVGGKGSSIKGAKEFAQSENAPTFYSALQKSLTNMPQGKGSATQWEGIIKNLTQKGIKAEEIEWSGVKDWLKEQKGNVTKEQLLDYLKANELKVEEVVKGGAAGKTYKYGSVDEYMAEIHRLERQKKWDESEALTSEMEEFELGDTSENGTKFNKYVLPGGENYRELLITLPKKDATPNLSNLTADYLGGGEWEIKGTDGASRGKVRIAGSSGFTPEEVVNHWYNSSAGKTTRAMNDQKADNYRSSHFDEPNILSHLRFNERTLPDGKRVMFIEEVQSDWHQSGREKGYKPEGVEEIVKGLREERSKIADERDALAKERDPVTNRIKNEEKWHELSRKMESLADTISQYDGDRSGVPNAPFKTTWPELAFKRALRWAVENNFDRVAWTTGEMQAERYDLSKQVESIKWHGNDDGTFNIGFKDKDGRTHTGKNDATITELPDIVGKELAKKIIAASENETGGLYSGLDLKVGGEGMKGFYDKILPATVNKLVKKWGAKVEETELPNAAKGPKQDINAPVVPREGESITEAMDRIERDHASQKGQESAVVHSVEITPEMRESVLGGQPLFQKARGKIRLAIGDTKAAITLFKTADASTFIHETGHAWLDEMMRYSKAEDAPEGLLKDRDTVNKWLGVKEGAEITRAQHEKFARGFERYLMEGTAPSKELATVFAKFKQWLTDIYKTVQKLRAPITDDIRHVFDRLLSANPERTVIAPEREGAEVGVNPQAHDATPEIAPSVADKTAEPNAPIPSGATESTSAPMGKPGETPQPPSASGTSDVAPESGQAQQEPEPGNPNGKLRKSESKFVDKAGNIRLDNLNTPEDINAVIRETANQNDNFMGARRGVISDGQVLDLADALGMNATEINKRKLGEAFNAEQVVAARKLLIKSAEDVRDLSMKAAEGEESDLMAYAKARARHISIQEQVSGITAEAGRALRAFRSLEGGQEAKAVGEFLKDSTGLDLFQLQDEAKKLSELDTAQKVSKLINDAKKPTYKDKILEYYINSLISGPITHLRYSMGNSLNALWTPLVEIPTAAGIGRIREIVTGKETPGRVYLGEAGAQLHGIIQGSKNGLQAAATAWKTSVSPALPGEEVSPMFATRTNAIGGVAGKIINVPSRGVAAIHSFFKSIRYEQNIQGLAYRNAIKEGLSEGTEAFTNRIAELANSPTEEMMDAATADSLKELFMSPTEYNSAAGALNRFTNSNLAAKIIMPFMKIGSQITRNAFIERTPLGLLTDEVRGRAFYADGIPEGDMQIAKMATGVALMGGMSSLVLEGLATGDGPTDPKQRAVWLLNHNPNSIQIGGITIRYQGLGHLGMLMRFSANMTETAHGWGEDQDGAKLAKAFMEGITRSVLDENFMRGLKDMLDAIYHPEEYGENYVRQFATNWLPFSVGMGQVAREIDPYHREARDLFDTARAKIPFASEDLQPKRDVFGEEIPNGGNQRYANDPVVQRLESLQTGIGKVERKIRGVKLTDQQYDDYAKLAGRMTKMRLENYVSIPGTADLPSGIQIKTISSMVDSSREMARRVVLMNNPDILKQAINNKVNALTKP